MTKVEDEMDEFGKRALAPLRQAPPIHPQVLSKEKARFLLQGDTLQKNFQPDSPQHQRNHAISFSRMLRGKLSLPVLRALVVTIFVLILVAGSSFSVYAAQGSLPGEPLYALKAAGEDIRLSLTISPQARLDLTLDYTNRRVNEIQSLVAGGKSLSDQFSSRYQQELEDALQLAAQLDDQQMQSALQEIKKQAEKQGMTVEELLSQLPSRASPAIFRLQERLEEQVQLSTFGEKNPQAFRSQVRERAQNRHGPKHTPNSHQDEISPNMDSVTPQPQQDNGSSNGKPTDMSGHGNPGNGQGQDNPGNGKHDPTPTQYP